MIYVPTEGEIIAIIFYLSLGCLVLMLIGIAISAIPGIVKSYLDFLDELRMRRRP